VAPNLGRRDSDDMKSLKKPTLSIFATLVIGALVLAGETAEAKGRRHSGDDDHFTRLDHHRNTRTIYYDNHHRRYAYVDQFGNVVIVRDGSRSHDDGTSRSSHHHRHGHQGHSGH
jgi:hypothetical protein